MQAQVPPYDVAVIGSGFSGIAHAYWAARRGLRVAVFERHASANGHSVRQSGLIRPLRESDHRLERAIRSAHTWLHLADMTGFYTDRRGSLLLAHSDLEMAVLEEFAAASGGQGYQVQCLTPAQTISRSPMVRRDELAGALYSGTEINIDPRQALRVLHAYLREEMGVCFYYRTLISEVSAPYLYNGRKRWRAEQIIVCGGQGDNLLYPDLYESASLRVSKLQYLRSQPQPIGWRLGPNLMTGLSLPHFPSFSACPSLPLLRHYYAERLPGYVRWGIDLALTQTVLGEINIGESHEYGNAPTPFDRREINELMLRYLHRIVDLPNPRIQETWHSLQLAPAESDSELIVQPEPGVIVINGLGDTELTSCFGIAQDLVLADFRLPDWRLTA